MSANASAHAESFRSPGRFSTRSKSASTAEMNRPRSSALSPSTSSHGMVLSNIVPTPPGVASPSSRRRKPARHVFASRYGSSKRARCAASIPQRIAPSAIHRRIVSTPLSSKPNLRRIAGRSSSEKISVAVHRLPGSASRARNVSINPLSERGLRSATLKGIRCCSFSGKRKTASMKGA